MQLITVSRTVTMGHRLHTYQGVCSSLHGHNVRIEVVIGVDDGLFVDFKQVDKSLKTLTDILDHAMIMHCEDPLLPVLRDWNEKHGGDYPLRLVELNAEPTTEAIAKLAFNWMHDGSLHNIVRTIVHETDKYRATYEGPFTASIMMFTKEME